MRSYNSGMTNGVANNTRDLVNYAASLTQNSSIANLELLGGMINDWHKKLLQKYFFNEGSTTIQTVGDQQAYLLPYNYSKLKTGTITIGDLRWTPTEILSRQDWDRLNVFPYYSDIPNNFFIYSEKGVGYINFWPIPSTGSTQITYTGLTGTLKQGDIITQVSGATGNILTVNTSNSTFQVAVTSFQQFAAGAFTDTTSGATGTVMSTVITPGNTITFNYKFRVPDFTFTDYITGTVLATNNSPIVTGSGTGWSAYFSPTPGNVQSLNLWFRATAPNGDGEWYQIQSIDSATQLTLLNNYQGATISGATYTIGQMPLLLEDFHDLLVAQPLVTYFSTIQPNEEKAAEFKLKLQEGITAMDDYVGSKALNVNLRGAVNTINPNLFPQNTGGMPNS